MCVCVCGVCVCVVCVCTLNTFNLFVNKNRLYIYSRLYDTK